MSKLISFCSDYKGKTNSLWSVQPRAGELDSYQSMKLKVMLVLREKGKHSDQLLISIANSRTISVALTATGVGTCIVLKPNIFPTFDMGLLFRSVHYTNERSKIFNSTYYYKNDAFLIT